MLALEVVVLVKYQPQQKVETVPEGVVEVLEIVGHLKSLPIFPWIIPWQRMFLRMLS